MIPGSHWLPRSYQDEKELLEVPHIYPTLLQLKRGDDWAQGRRIDLIKIDVEGYEAPALSGLRETLRESEPLILMEVTASSVALFEEYGGLEKVLPFAASIHIVQNPAYPLKIFQRAQYSLRACENIKAGTVSHNVLIVPDSRRDVLVLLQGDLA